MLHRINIFQALYERFPLPEGLPPILVGGSPLPDQEHLNDLGRGRDAYSLRLVPDYFQLSNLPPGYELKSVPQDNWGHSIDLSEVTSVEQYMESQFKSKPRSIIKRYIKRLEHCFPISYKYHYGEMDLNDYERVFDSLYNMISERFVQRDESHMEVWRWDALKNNTYELICSKKASFFVIYDGDLPIEISLNYHLNDVLFSSISSFDIDYAKFGLGHVEIYKQLEWCFKHGYTRFEMGVGGMDYKRRWSNRIYRFNHWILIPKTSTWSNVQGKLEYIRIRIKEYLKSKKINEIKDYPLKKWSSFNRDKGKDLIAEPAFVPLAQIPNVENLISYSASELHKDCKKEVNDLLYLQEVSLKEIKVFKSHEGLYVQTKSKWFLLDSATI